MKLDNSLMEILSDKNHKDYDSVRSIAQSSVELAEMFPPTDLKAIKNLRAIKKLLEVDISE